MTPKATVPLVLIAACAAEPPPPIVPDAGPAAVVLGGTDSAGAGFLPLEGDQQLVAGGQGGFHVWLKFRISGIAPGQTRIVRTVRRVSDDRLILMTDTVLDVGPAGPNGFWELPNALPSFMCPSPVGVQVNDEPVRFQVTVVDVATTQPLAEGTAVATPRCPASGDSRAACLRICAG